MSNRDSRSIRRVGIALVTANASLVLAKVLGWYVTGSIAIGSEAAHSLVDVLYSLIIFFGVMVSTREPTDTYPEGYERVEPIVALAVSGGVLLTGTLVLSKSIRQLSAVGGVQNPLLGVTVLITGVVVKYWLYRYCMKVGEASNSPVATAAGIDNRNDILISFVAIIGLAGGSMNIEWADGVAAILISVAIIYSGIEIAKSNIGYLVGRSPDEEQCKRLRKAALKHPDVHGVHDVEIHYSGPSIDISMHLEVEGDMTVERAHEIEKRTADKLREASSRTVNEINLHVDPETLGEWK